MQNQNDNFKMEFEKRLKRFAIDIIRFCTELRKDRNYWVVADQLTDSGTSVGANTREAKSASSKRDYIKFFEIALKSANESGFWLEIIVEGASGPLALEAKKLLDEINQIARILASGLITMKGKNKY